MRKNLINTNIIADHATTDTPSDNTKKKHEEGNQDPREAPNKKKYRQLIKFQTIHQNRKQIHIDSMLQPHYFVDINGPI